MQSNEEILADLSTPASGAPLAGRSALVTGASSGIGEAIARVLAAAGARVVVHGRDLDRARRVASAITSSGGRAEVVTADLAGTPDEVRALAKDGLAAAGGQLDILVNNAGVYPVSPTEALADDDLDAMLTTNIRAPHVLVAELVPAMAERGQGVVVNVGSWMAHVGTPFGAMYTATKAALEQLTRNWSAEYGPRGVRVNTVAPGATATPGNADSADVLAMMTATTVPGRPVRPVDIAYAVRYLASDEAAFVHGVVLPVDGGIGTVQPAPQPAA